MTTTQNQMIITTTKGQYHGAVNSTDGTEIEIQILTVGGSLVSVGKHLKGQTIKGIEIQSGDGSILSTAIYYGKDSGIIYSWVGNERTSNQRANLSVGNLNHVVEDGETIKVNTTD